MSDREVVEELSDGSSREIVATEVCRGPDGGFISAEEFEDRRLDELVEEIVSGEGYGQSLVGLAQYGQ